MDTINSNVNALVNGTSNADSIVNEYTLEWNSGGTTGYIYGYSTINAGAGADTIVNHGYKAIVNGDAGDDYIINDSWSSTLNGGTGDDTIISEGNYALAYNQLNGGAGNDYLVNTGGTAGGISTINGGTGSDTIDVTGAIRTILTYAPGDGDDLVIGYYDCDSIQLTGGAQVNGYSLNGNDLILKVGTGSITIKDGKDKMINFVNNNTHLIYTSSGVKSAVNNTATSGNDTINLSNTGYINSGAGNDYIVANTFYNSIINVEPGKGNDTLVTANSSYVTYREGDGNDVIIGWHNYNSTDSKVVLYSDTDPIFYAEGDDYILQVGTGTITFKDALKDDSRNYIQVERYTKSGTRQSSKDKKYTPSDGNAYTDGIDLNNSTANANIVGTTRKDTVNNSGENANISVGAGDDYVINWGKGSTVDGGEGNDHIRSDADNALINGGAGNDYLYNQASNVTINGGAGNDTLYGNSSATKTIYNGDAGADKFEIYSSSSTISGGAGADTIVNAGANNVIDGGADNDVINNSGDGATINGGAGADVINNTADNVSVNGGAGNDNITSTGNNVTITGGAGNDNITLGTSGGNLIQFSAADGSDTITNFSIGDSLQITGEIISQGSVKSGNSYRITVQDDDGNTGTIYLKGEGAYDFKYNEETGILTINDAEYPEVVENPDAWTDDEVYSNEEDDVKFSTEDVDEYGQNTYEYPINYILENTGENVTMSGGYGSDTLTGSETYGEVFEFNGFGKDVITSFASNDTLKLVDSDFVASQISGNDLIIYVTNLYGEYGSITLKDVASDADIFKFSNDNSTFNLDAINVVRNTQSNHSIQGSTGRDRIYNTGDNVTINSRDANDTIISSAKYGEVFLFGATSGNNLVQNYGVNDTIAINIGSISASTKSGDDFVFTFKNGKNTGTVTLQGAADYEWVVEGKQITARYTATIENSADGVEINGTTNDDVIVNSGSGVTITGSEGNDTIEGSNLGQTYAFAQTSGNNVIENFNTNDKITATSGTISGAVSGDDYIVTIKSGKISSVNTLVGAAQLPVQISSDKKTLTVKNASIITNTANKKKVTGTAGDDIIVNTGSNVTISPGKGDDTITGSDTYGEKFIFTSASGNNVITNFGRNDTLLASSSSYKIADVAIEGDDAIVTIQNKAGSASSKVTLLGAGNYEFKQTATKLTAESEINNVYNESSNVKITGTSGRDYIINGGDLVTIQAGSGNDTIVNSIFRERLQFTSVSGSDVVYGFGEDDTIQITSGKITTIVSDGEDKIIKIGSKASVTLKDAADLNLVTDAKGTYATVSGAAKQITNTTNRAVVSGTSGKDVITNYAEGVTIKPLAGNDTITGSDFYGDVFEMTQNYGNNIITNFGAGDTLYATSGKISTVKSGDDIIATVTKNGKSSKATLQGAATLLGAADVKVTLTNGKTKLYVTPVATAIENDSDDVFLAGTDEADTIVNSAQGVTINGGGGDDYIEASDVYSEIFQFDALGGNDTIDTFGENDVLQVTYGTIKGIKESGDNYIVTVEDDDGNVGTVTLKDAKKNDHNFRLKNNEIALDVAPTIRSSQSDVKISGTAFSDRIYALGQNVTVNGGNGNDTITGSDYANVFQFAADGGKDVITNFGKNDSLQIVAGKVVSSLLSGDDYIIKVASNINSGIVTLQGAGQYKLEVESTDEGDFFVVDDISFINNTADRAKVTGTAKADYISNSGANVTISPGKGNDTIEGSNLGERFRLAQTSGKNLFLNFDANDTLEATSGTISGAISGDDYIVTVKSGSTSSVNTLVGAAGLNFTLNSKKTLLTVGGVKTFINTANKKTITGTDGADYIVNTGENVTINSGKGNDTIYGSDLYGERFRFGYTTGEDVIMNFGVNDTLSAVTSGSVLSVTADGDDHIVTISKNGNVGTVILKDTADYIFKQSGLNLVVDAVNTVENDNDGAVVVGTSGRDLIINSGNNATIRPMGGDDTIYGSVFGEVFSFAYTHGNNVIENFGVNDTLHASSGTISSWTKSGDDMVVTISSETKKTTSTITLVGMGDQTFKKSGRFLVADVASVIENDENDKKVSGTSGNDYIVNTGENVIIEGKGGNDTITGSDAYADVFRFAATDGGENLIVNFNRNDTLEATRGTITAKADGNDMIVTISDGTNSTKVTLQNEGTSRFQVRYGNQLVMLKSGEGSGSASNAQAPADEDGYWFMSEDYTEVPVSEIDTMISEAEVDTAVGKLALGTDAEDLLTSLDGKALDRSLVTVGESARRKAANK